VPHRTIEINHQPDATIFQFIILTFVYSSTCFGRFPAHHQELNESSGSLWFYLHIVVTVVLCSWSGRRPDHEHRPYAWSCSKGLGVNCVLKAYVYIQWRNTCSSSVPPDKRTNRTSNYPTNAFFAFFLLHLLIHILIFQAKYSWVNSGVVK
jgi:hypothetical protein